jgi:hypothetical protein
MASQSLSHRNRMAIQGRVHVVAALAVVLAGCKGSSLVRGSEGGIPDVALPPVIDASFPVVDSALTRDKQTFACGTLSGAATATLVCNRTFPSLNWDVEPGNGFLVVAATIAASPGIDASLAGPVGLEILTPARISPLTETCATLPPPIPGALKPSFTAAFSFGLAPYWSAACGSATQVLPGTSFELVITSPGTLTSDSAGADPLDASADAFDWATLNREVLSNSFHGTLKATLVGPDGGSPLYVSLIF